MMVKTGLEKASRLLLADVSTATANSPNEQNLRHEIEKSLEQQCAAISAPWVPYQLDRALRNARGQVRFTDVVHGALIIEYEPPSSFRGGKAKAVVRHAKLQAEDYARRMSFEEGRPVGEYQLMIWDGAHAAFGRSEGSGKWERVRPFDLAAAKRLLGELRDEGRPLVHPDILRVLIGPDSPTGDRLIPPLFCSLVASAGPGAGQTKTTLLFKEWNRLFGQSIGVQTERLQAYLAEQSRRHDQPYAANVPAFLLSLHTYIGIVAKLVAAMSLPNAAQDMADAAVPVRQRFSALESGRLFSDAGVSNMLGGDFFSWYVDDENWPTIETGLEELLGGLTRISFDVARKEPESVRDLFKGIYEVFVPRELRHALGEVYTPDWLASHAMDELGWSAGDDLLDPTCGTGTFLLEALKRRVIAARDQGCEPTAAELLRGIYGIDLNPLAVLAAKASLIVVLAGKLDPASPITLPVYLADAINSADPSEDGTFRHSLQTEMGVQTFEVPTPLVNSPSFFPIFEQLRRWINDNVSQGRIMEALASRLGALGLSAEEIAGFGRTVEVLLKLHQREWNGIWCSILADRFAAGAIHPVTHIAGNPPWVKWSHLPPEYAKFIKPHCLAMNVFSRDRYVGGIESDISTVITFKAIQKWLAPHGKLAFFITGTVFANESSQGFRRFQTSAGEPIAAIRLVEDFKEVAPFEGVTNHPSLLVVEQGRTTQYPVMYRVYSRADGKPTGPGAIPMTRRDLLASPVPGSDAGPWLKGTAGEHEIWSKLFDAGQESHYKARKGITTDLNGVYFVRASPAKDDTIWIENDPSIGRTGGLAIVRRLIERVHVFPLIRGRGVRAFNASVDPDFKVIIPQRGMHGDPDLPVSSPRTHGYLQQFEKPLKERGSYRRYQAEKPYWSTWSTGPYTFAEYKVLWKEMGGAKFCAAYVGPNDDPLLGRKVVIPDHKLYFVPVSSEPEARYLTGILNASTIAGAISAYASQLSLGTNVIEYLKLPPFDTRNKEHLEIAEIAAAATNDGGNIGREQAVRLAELAFNVVSHHS
jgi:hypothetical protein